MSDAQRKKYLKQIWIGDQEMYALSMKKGDGSEANEEVYMAKKPIQLE